MSNNIFKEMIDLSEQLLEKINQLNKRVDRKKLDEEDYAVTSYRDDLLHYLGSIELTKEQEDLLTEEIKRATKLRREIKDMIFFLNNRKQPLSAVSYELEKFTSQLRGVDTTYFVRTEEGVKFFEENIGEEYIGDIKVSLESKKLMRSNTLSGEFDNAFEFIQSITSNDDNIDYSDQTEESTLVSPVREEEIIAPYQEYRNYVLQSSPYSTWQLYSRVEKKIIRVERELENMISYIRQRNLKVNYHHYMTETEVEELLKAFEENDIEKEIEKEPLS